MKTIGDVDRYVAELPLYRRHVFSRLFDVRHRSGTLNVGEDMKSWVEETFGSVRDVETQRVTRIQNRFTGETTLFNDLRTKRPVQSKEGVDVDKVLQEENDVFSDPVRNTPEDSFGRIHGEYCVTASNIAKYDAYHGLLIFDDANPLRVTEDALREYFDVAEHWFHSAANRGYPLVPWNCLWKAAASINHGHMQLLVAEETPYQGPKTWLSAAEKYREVFEESFTDALFTAHKDVGLALERNGVRVFQHLTPVKEKEVIITAEKLGEPDLSVVFHDVLRTYIEDLGVESFNVGIYLPPLHEEDWDLPVIIRLVDRGSLAQKTADIGGMEIYGGESVVGSDPYKVFSEPRRNLTG